MAKLKLGAIADDKSVELTVELPAAVHRGLLAYAEVLARETGQGIAEPTKLIAPMFGAVHGNGSRICKSPSRISSAIDRQRIALSQ
jgi:hypothetical protein